jgi:hypothetical protein
VHGWPQQERLLTVDFLCPAEKTKPNLRVETLPRFVFSECRSLLLAENNKETSPAGDAPLYEEVGGRKFVRAQPSPVWGDTVKSPAPNSPIATRAIEPAPLELVAGMSPLGVPGPAETAAHAPK